MAGQCLVEALRAIGATTITVANGYFRPDWSAGINRYLEAAGFEIMWAGDLIDQGLVADHDEKLAIEAATLWDYPDHLMAAAAVDAHRQAPDADAIVQTGAGFRMLQVADAVEERTETPVVASDVALYWAMLSELGLSAAPGHGSLLAMLGGRSPDMTGGGKILALWAVPRSTSTAFEWMMRMRGDMTCFHEPFGEVWYQGESPDWPRLQPDSVRTPGLTYQSAWATLRSAAADGPVFIKDFPLYLEALWGDDFFDCFTHSFIIRDPAKTLTSMYKHWPDFHIKETGFAEQRDLFDHLACQRRARRHRSSTATICWKTRPAWWRPGVGRWASSSSKKRCGGRRGPATR